MRELGERFRVLVCEMTYKGVYILFPDELEELENCRMNQVVPAHIDPELHNERIKASILYQVSVVELILDPDACAQEPNGS